MGEVENDLEETTGEWMESWMTDYGGGEIDVIWLTVVGVGCGVCGDVDVNEGWVGDDCCDSDDGELYECDNCEIVR